MTTQFSQTLGRISLLAQNIAIDEEIEAINQSPYEVGNLIEYAKLFKRLKTYSSLSELSGNLMVYFKFKNKLLSSTLNINTVSNDDFLNKYTDYSSGVWELKKDTSDVLVFVQGIFNGQWKTNLAVVIEIPISYITRTLRQLNVKDGGTVFLYTLSGVHITSNNDLPISYDSVYEQIMQSGQENARFSYAEASSTYEIIYSYIPKHGLILGTVYQQERFMQPILRIQYFILIILILELVIAVFFTFYSYKSILAPIHELVYAMSQLREGDLGTRLCISSRSELGFMATSFNDMAGRIDSLINEVYLEKIKTQQAQYKYLQSQINPHFLYNCLYLIYDMSNAENNEAAANMALYLGDYYKYITGANIDRVRLADEIDHVKTYIMIQKMRHGQKIAFTIDTDESLNECYIPKLILQPLIENAIIHGMENKLGSGNIWLSIYEEDECIVLNVEDDGCGIENDRLSKLINEINIDNSTSYGLSNIYWRLKLKYGETGGLSIENRVPGGTCIKVRIPKENGDNVNV